jgi:hypothetical protein
MQLLQNDFWQVSAGSVFVRGLRTTDVCGFSPTRQGEMAHNLVFSM